MQRQPRSIAKLPNGFTVVELLVAIAIIGVLLSVSIPAVQASREQARRIQCQNHLKQQILAVHDFAAAQSRYPHSTLSTPVMNAAGATSATASCQVHLFPFLDQASVFRSVNRAESGSGLYGDPPTSMQNSHLMSLDIPIFRCPSDRVWVGGLNYRACTGSSPNQFEAIGPTTVNSSRIGWMTGTIRRPADVRDGLSHTIFLSERLGGDHDAANFDPESDLAYVSTGGNLVNLPDDAVALCSSVASATLGHYSSSGASWFPGRYGCAWYNHVLTPNSRISDCTDEFPFAGGNVGAYSARSHHPHGVNVALGDGSSRFINDQIDVGAWRALGTINGSDFASQGE